MALSVNLFKEMRKNPRVIGVKNSSMPTQDIQGFVDAGGEHCVVFNGPDEQFIAGRAIGACGGIGGTYAAMPELFLKMDELVKAGKFVEAQPIQHEVNAIIGGLCSCRGHMYAVIKKVLQINEGLELGSVHRPMVGVTEEDMPKVEAVAARIRAAIEKYC